MKKKMNRVLIFLGCLCLSFFSMDIKAAEDFYIHNLDIQMNVGEDGVLSVKEDYSIFFKSLKRGFYRSIPIHYQMNWDIDGKEVERNYIFPITNIHTYETESKIERKKQGIIIRLGDPDQYVQGLQKYVITYDVHMRDLDLDGKQMLYWNLIGNGFDTYINNFSFLIHMPKEFDANQVKVYSGAYGSTQSEVKMGVDGNTIYGNSTRRLQANEALTIKVDLEDGYFVFQELPSYVKPILLTMLGIFILVILFCRKYIKKDEMVVTVEFSAPDGLSSAEIGYIVDGIVDNKDIFSFILDWARRGYIIIHEKDNAFSLEKIKDLDESCPLHEKVFFHSLFVKDAVMITQDDFREERIKVGLSTSKIAMQTYFEEKSRKIFLKGSFMVFSKLMLLCAWLPSVLLLFNINFVYYGIVEFDYLIIFGILGILIILMLQYQKRYAMKKKQFQRNRILCILALCIFIGFIFVKLNNHYPKDFIFHIGYCILTTLFTYFMLRTRQRTQEGHRKFCKILGLREFIETCEKEKLELLVHENPTAFFDILPYAYVLGLSNAWASKFEDIAMECPNWYRTDVEMSTFSTTLWWNAFHTSFADTMISNIEFHGNSTPGGGRISGGFSGGGFGGGGGGSW